MVGAHGRGTSYQHESLRLRLGVLPVTLPTDREHDHTHSLTHSYTHTHTHTLIIRSREKRNPKTADPLHVRNNEEHKEKAEAATNA